MKLWKSKKPTSCVPGKTNAKNKNEDRLDSAHSSTTISAGDRAMSPAQSEDSGLATDRGTTYATISLPRENVVSMGIVLADRTDLSYPPIIASLNAYGPAADFLAPGDRIHQIDNISTIGLTNNHILNILLHGDGLALIEIEYCLPEYISQSSLCVSSKLAQITVERENGCLGLTLRGGGDIPLIVTNVRPHGPAFITGRIKPGDRLLRVDNISLINKTLSEAQQILKCGHLSGFTNLTIEYDVSIMQSVEFSLGPLLIEIERPMNDKLGLVLSNYSTIQHNDHNKMDEVVPAGVYVANILPASIADRCGAISVGDQILSIDETIIENTTFSPEDVMAFLDANTTRGFTQIQVMPAHALARRGINCGNFNTLESRKNTRQRKYTRKSSLPIDPGTSTLHQNIGVCRSEIIQVVLDCSQGSGLVLNSSTTSHTNKGYVISQIVPESVADRSGCIQKGDRLLSINKLYNLDLTTIRQILGDITTKNHNYQGTHWVEIEIEFDLADTVIPSSGVFNVKLAKTNRYTGLGITVNGTNQGTFIITDVKLGSPAHRTGSLRSGDILLAVDSHTLQHFNVDALLKDNKNEFTMLTIKRNSLPDFLFDAQQKCNALYSSNSNSTNHSNSNSNNNISKCTINNNNNNNNSSNSNNNNNNNSSIKNTIGNNHHQDGDEQTYIYNMKYGGGDATIRQYGCNENKAGQPIDYYQIEQSGQSTPIVQIRRPFIRNNDGSDGLGDTVCWSTEENNPLNTHSLTTEVTDDQYNEIAHFDMDYHQKYMSFDSNNVPPPMENQLYGNGTHSIIINVRLETNGGPLGITLAGSEDLQKPIIISGLIEGGVVSNTGKINIGDNLLAINGENVQGMPLSHATKLLQNLSNIVDLKVSRNIRVNDDGQHGKDFIINNLPQPQAVYARIQRRPRSPSFTDAISNSSKDDRFRSFHVTLYKDKVYDDYGFSVSDGLYERGVYINRIRNGGPADIVGLLKPYDRIMQVNGTKTKDFDCCLTVPLIASAGDKIDLVLQRPIND